MGGIAGCSGGTGPDAARTLARMLLCPAAVGRPTKRASVAPLVVFGARDSDIAEDRDRRESLALGGYARRSGRPCGAAELLAAWRQEGVRVLDSLTGEFCLAALVGGRVLVARDALGTRPMYVAELPGGSIGFSTSMFALVHAGARPDLNHDAIVRSLVLGYPTSPSTALASVEQVGPGEVWELAPRRRVRRWYQSQERLRNRSFAASVRAVDRTLGQAVRDATPPGARVAAFLSGGIDSSVVLARVHESGTPVEAFTLFFGETVPGEIRYARAVAAHLGVTHHVLEVDARRFCDGIEPAVTHLEDVLSEAIAVPNFLLAREASRSADVLFTGEGGDQSFGGTKNIGMFLAHAYAGHPAAPPLAHTYLALYQNFGNDVHEALEPHVVAAFDAGRLANDVGRLLRSKGHGSSFLGRVMIANTVFKGGNNILVKAAKMIGYAHDLGVRSPMFDRRVVDLAFTIPPAFKMDGIKEKLVLRKAALRLLPPWVVDRPKRGMTLPMEAWSAGELGALARDVLTEQAVRDRGLMRWPYVRRLLEQATLPGDLVRPRPIERLWLALVTELHHRAIDRAASAARSMALRRTHAQEAARA